MRDRELSVLFYTLANLNLIDGSSIWMQSVAEALHLNRDLKLTVVTRAPQRRPIVTDGLRRLGRGEVIDPRTWGRHDPAGMQIDDSVDLLARLDAERHFDVVLLRAYDLCLSALRRMDAFTDRLW